MKHFLKELKRRRVFRVAAVYAVVGWVLVQVAAISLPAFGAPPWVLRVVIALVVLGFPIALVLAWAFESSPEGVRRTRSETGSDDEAGARRMAPATWLVTGIVIAVVGLGFATLRDGSAPEEAAEGLTALADSAPAPIRSIAVLPFTNLSVDESNEYFSDGITEDILTALAKIGDLHVISRTSSMAYKGTDKTLRAIGEELGVAAILEGSVRRQGDRVRIVAQLIDARDDRHLWAETYDRELTDLFAIQSEIAEAIASSLHAELSDVERERILAGGTENLDAYELYLQGRELVRAPQNLELNETAIAYFRRALELDPDYALAHAGLATAYVWHQEYQGVAWGDSAILSAARAISRDPRAAEGYAAMSMIQGWWGLRDESIKNLRLALERNPNHADAVAGMAYALDDLGRLDEALDWSIRAVTLEPTHAPHYTTVGWILADLGASAAAERWFDHRLEMTPDDPEAYHDFVDFHLMHDRVDRAERYYERMVELDPDATITLRAGVDLAIERGELEMALDFFERWHERLSAEWEPRDELGWVQTRLGRLEEAQASLRHAEEMALLWIGRGDQGAWTHLVLAQVHVTRGETDAAIRSLERAVEQGALGLGHVRSGPSFERLRDDPRLGALLERVDRKRERMREAAGADALLPPGDRP